MSVVIDRYMAEARYLGKWVLVDDSHLGYGRCLRKLPEGVLVQYTDIPNVRHHEEVVPFGQARLVRIPVGARVWLPTGSFGWVGAEVTAWAGFDEYRVRVPEQTREFKLPSERLVLRWNRPLTDPTLALENGFCDTPEYYEARRDFLDQLVIQRRVARGLTAVLSASINLYQHQVDTVARVMGDPVMRYLLADEVGLGKTIEAGLVLRQVLLDDESARVAVLVPSELQEQWHAELGTRLLLSQQLWDKRLLLVPHEEAVVEGLPHGLALVVVDEAHQLLPGLERRPFLRQQLLAVPGLLLLSATPMRGDLGNFQRLLNLVDETAFPLGRLDAFAARVDEREQEASRLDLLTSQRTPTRQKESVLDRLLENHPDDQVLGDLVATCRAEFDSRPAPGGAATLSNYVRETYRISRRMIRHRRSVGPARGYPVAGRRPFLVPVVDPDRAPIDDFLDRYLLQNEGEVDPQSFGRLLEHALAGTAAIVPLLSRELALTASRVLRTEQDKALAGMLVDRLVYQKSTERFSTAIAVAEKYLREGGRVVALSANREVARAFHEYALASSSHRVLRHFSSDSAVAAKQALATFLDEGEASSLLVGDRTLEEGRNLQDATALINLDLPLDLNRLEQRIGRLDRFAVRQSPADIVVLTEAASPWVQGFVRLLQDGVGIFDDSVAALQRRLAVLNAQLIEDVAQRGQAALDLDLEALREEMAYEREEVDLLEEVESVGAAVEFDDEALESLEDYESNTEGLSNAWERLVSHRGGIGLPLIKNQHRGTFRLDERRKKMAVNISVDDLATLEPLLRRDRAFDRTTAVAHEGVAPLRLGDPLVDWLDDYLRNDERGRARAWIRYVDDLHVPQVWFASDFLIEFDAAHLPTGLEADSRRLRRRGDALLPPALERTWTDASGTADDVLVDKHLKAPFDPVPDQLLRGDKVWQELLEALPDWQEQCRNASSLAREALLASNNLTRRIEEALRAWKRDSDRRLQVLSSRSLRLPTEAERAGSALDMQREEGLLAGLRRGIENPSVVQVAAAAVVLWPEAR